MKTFPLAALKAALKQGNGPQHDDQMVLAHQASRSDMAAVVRHLKTISAATRLAARQPQPRP